jgi:aspartyl protease family protein
MAVVVLAAALALAGAARAADGCRVGREVIDDRGRAGSVVGEHEGMCLVKYGDGRALGWVAARDLRSPPPASQAAAPSAAGAPASQPGAVTVVRPTTVNRLVFPADALGHVVLTVQVNGSPVHFLVDTGATLVALSPADAQAAGLKREALAFSRTVNTANGPVPAAVAQLREMRIGELEVDNVPAAVIDNLKQSVLGMSFLSRLKGFDMKGGVLTMTW